MYVIRNLLCNTSIVAVCLLAGSSLAIAQSSKVVQGIEVSYGITTAANVDKSRDRHDGKMHKRGRIFPRGSHHLVVALKDQSSGRPINNATVRAFVHALDGSAVERKLEPMHIADSVSYGGYFDLPASGSPYKLVFNVSAPNISSSAPLVAEFEYRSQDAR